MNYACREKFAGEKLRISTIGAEKPPQCPGTSANDPPTVTERENQKFLNPTAEPAYLPQ